MSAIVVTPSVSATPGLVDGFSQSQPSDSSSLKFDQVFSSVGAEPPTFANSGSDGSLVLSDGTTLSITSPQDLNFSSTVAAKLLSLKEDGVSQWKKMDELSANLRQNQNDNPTIQDNVSTLTSLTEISHTFSNASMETSLKINVVKKSTDGIQQLVRAQ
jgi:hypothetical protein